MTLVVGSPDINYPFELTLNELVVMVGDIGGKVGRRTVAADDNVVLIFA